MSSIKGTLSRISDELDSIQCAVELRATDAGIVITAKTLADRLIAKREVERAGLTVAPYELHKTFDTEPWRMPPPVGSPGVGSAGYDIHGGNVAETLPVA